MHHLLSCNSRTGSSTGLGFESGEHVGAGRGLEKRREKPAGASIGRSRQPPKPIVLQIYVAVLGKSTHHFFGEAK